MGSNRNAFLLLAGAGVLLLASANKRKPRSRSRPNNKQPDEREGVFGDEDLDIEDSISDRNADFSEEVFSSSNEGDESSQETPVTGQKVLIDNIDPDGKANLGMLYQVREGDSPIDVCLEALFGSRDVQADQAMLAAAEELLVRINCGPWNQANYGVNLQSVDEYGSYFAHKGVSFTPIYSDNFDRIHNGESPTSTPGDSFPLVWIPMINMDKFDKDGVITTEGMYYPDTADGRGGSMIDPPEEILSLGFEEISSQEVGCDLPEGDFRKTIIHE